jgi:tetratricopeptide (TPR) repeat protein
MKPKIFFAKPVLLIFLIIIGALTSKAFAFIKAPSDSFRYEGYIKSANENVPGVNINVYIDNNKVTSASSNRQGGFHLYLQHNKIYLIEFVKKDYILEKIQLETKIPDEDLKKGGIELSTDNEIEIFEYFVGLKTAIFDNPVLYYYFNPKTFLIEENLKKSKTAQLNATRSSVTSSKNKLAAVELKNADALFKKKKYEEALASYSRVLEYAPQNQNAIDKAKEVKKLLRKEPDFESNYKAVIVKADGLFGSKNYNDAKENYKKAKILKPEDTYPEGQLYILDSILTRLFILNKNEYDKLVKSADQEFKDKKYEGAQKEYETALALQVDFKYPQKQIDAIKLAIAAEKKKKEDEAKVIEAKYNNLIKKGDDYMSKNDFANASAIYKQSLDVKPQDTYATTQKEKADKSLTEAAIEKLKKRKDKNYNDTIALGDKAIKSKDYKLAMTMFSAALEIKPSESYPAKEIKEINRLMSSNVGETVKQITDKPGEKPKEKLKSDKPSQASTGKASNGSIKDLQSSAEEQEKKGNIAEASRIYMGMANLFRDNGQLGKALNFLNKAFSMLKKKGDKAGEAQVLGEIATVYYDSGQYRQTVSTYREALALKKELGDAKGQAEILSEMGNVLENTYQYEIAVEALSEALVIRQQMGDNEGVSEVSNKLGGLYYSQNDYKNSIQFFNKALTIAESSNNKDTKGSLLNSLGVVYYKMGKYDEAIKYYNQSISVDKESGNKKNMSLSYNNIGNINFDWSKYEKAIEYYQRSLALKKELNFEQGMAASMFNIGNSYLELKNFLKANEFLSSGLELAKKINFREVMQLSYKALSKLYENTSDFRGAMNAYKSFVAVIGPGGIVEGQISEMTDMYERESKLIKTLRHELERQKFLTDYQAMQTLQKQKEIQFKDLELKNQKSKTLKQRILLIFTLICLGFAGMLALQFYRRYKEKKHYSDVIGFQKQQITDSIAYASRIQKAVCVPTEVMKSVFPESFIFNRPKDIVSGDYFYLAAKKEKVYFAVADCTGHGVPGAFMSMLGISLIKEVINQDKELLANEVLDELRDVLIKALHQTGRDGEAKDGMDIALCVIDHSKMQLEYSGANNSCYIIRDNLLIELKADRMPIGIHPIIKPFTSKPIKLVKDDVIYLSSDGFRDQIGGELNKKFKVGKFHEMLIDIHSQPLDKQPEILEKRHIDWRSDMEQTDDILIVGVKV